MWPKHPVNNIGLLGVSSPCFLALAFRKSVSSPDLMTGLETSQGPHQGATSGGLEYTEDTVLQIDLRLAYKLKVPEVQIVLKRKKLQYQENIKQCILLLLA